MSSPSLSTRDAVIELMLVVSRMHLAFAQSEVALRAIIAAGVDDLPDRRGLRSDAIRAATVALDEMTATSATSWSELMALLERMGGSLE